jgi:hypothetical protein
MNNRLEYSKWNPFFWLYSCLGAVWGNDAARSTSNSAWWQLLDTVLLSYLALTAVWLLSHTLLDTPNTFLILYKRLIGDEALEFFRICWCPSVKNAITWHTILHRLDSVVTPRFIRHGTVALVIMIADQKKSPPLDSGPLLSPRAPRNPHSRHQPSPESAWQRRALSINPLFSTSSQQTCVSCLLNCYKSWVLVEPWAVIMSPPRQAKTSTLASELTWFTRQSIKPRLHVYALTSKGRKATAVHYAWQTSQWSAP